MRRRFDPDVDHRRSVRLQGYDYARGTAVFVTICAYMREPLFGDLAGGSVRLGEIGRIIEQCWLAIPDHFPGVALDAFVIRPNHLHGILIIPGRPTGPLVPHNAGPASGSLGAIVGSFKSSATRRANELRNSPGTPIWQRNYYEHVIAREDELVQVRAYIDANPANWVTDELCPQIRTRPAS